jgi:hypothetical protein
MEEYNMILRHKDTEEAFAGYDYNVLGGGRRRL